MGAPSLSLLCALLSCTIGSEFHSSSTPSIEDSITSLNRKVLELEESVPLTIQEANEELLIRILDLMAKESETYAVNKNVLEMGAALRKEFHALMSRHSSHVEQIVRNQTLLINKLSSQMEDFQSSGGQPEDEGTPASPPDTRDAPDLCQDGTIDAITRTQDGSSYVFKDNFYWKLLLPRGISDPRRISDDWDGLEGNLDAALTWSSGKTFFFKGGNYWRFTNKVMHRGYPKLIRQGFEGIPDRLDAALVWSGNGKTYFFKGDRYWRYDTDQEPRVSDSFPTPVAEWNVPLEGGIDAAFQWENNRTYFFKNNIYYKYDDITLQVESDDINPPFPRSTSVWWFGC